jgi:hypothetical protein
LPANSADWQGVKLEGLTQGFELWVNEKPVGTITVVGDNAVFDPPLLKARTRKDGWVTEDELWHWAQKLRLTALKADKT